MTVFAVVGPSGAGKDTLLAGALTARPDLRVLRRTITRPTSAGGEDFEGVSDAEFARRLATGEFALHWQAHGLNYAIPHPPPGGVTIFNCSRQMLADAARVFAGLRVINVTASPEVLAQRLAARGREDAADIASRLAREAPLPAGLPVTTVVNDGAVADGVAAFLNAIDAAGDAPPLPPTRHMKVT